MALPSNAVIVIDCGFIEPVPNDVAFIVWDPGEAATTITGAADFTLVTEQIVVFVFWTPSPSVNVTGIVTLPVSALIDDALVEKVIVAPLTEPFNPFVNVGVPIEVNLSTPPSTAVTVIVSGEEEPLPLESAAMVWVPGVAAISIFAVACFDFV